MKLLVQSSGKSLRAMNLGTKIKYVQYINSRTKFSKTFKKIEKIHMKWKKKIDMVTEYL